MLNIDKNYTEYYGDPTPDYPGGKAIDAPDGDSFEGTPWNADWFNNILGFFYAAILKAKGAYKVSGTPETAKKSDILDALIEIMKNTANPNLDKRITANTENIEDNTKIIEIHADEIKGLLEFITRAVTEAPDNGRMYGRIDKNWKEITLPSGMGGDALEALKFFSKKSIMLTNAETADRRLKHYDIGLPYLSYASEVYHFDGDFKNQNQGTSIELEYGNQPVFVGSDDTNGTIYFDSAVLDIPPYEQNGKSLLGAFSIRSDIPSTDSTVEFWIRFPQISDICILRLKSDMQEEIILRTAGTDPEYSEPYTNDIPYCLPAGTDPEYSTAASSDNRIYHVSPKGSESASITGVSLLANSWLHIAAVSSASKLTVYIGNKQFAFNRHYSGKHNMKVSINEDQHEINLDELMLDRVAALPLTAFSTNTVSRKPYGALDHNKNWAVLMFDDPEMIVTNLFESNQFKMAVKAAVYNK